MIHFRRLASFLLGVWIATGVLSDATALWNLRSADRFLESPGVRSSYLEHSDPVHVLGRDRARAMLRRFAAEQNLWSYEQLEWLQLAVGFGLLLTLVFGSRPPLVAIGLCLPMLLIVLVDRFGLTNWSGGLSGRIDLENAAKAATPRVLYSILEFVKLALGLGVALSLVLRKPADPRMFVRQSEKEEAARLRK